MKDWLDQLIPKVAVPCGKSGAWEIDQFEISAADVEIENMRMMFQPGMGRRTMQPGRYTRLCRNSSVVMSDTHAERMDVVEPVRLATGRILINGLGLGVVLNACLLKPEVTHATVVELSSDVIALSADHWRNKFKERVEIVHGDALIWRPPKNVRYGMVWHDIWNDICADNLDDMKALRRKYGKRADYQGSWCRHLCELNR